MAFSPHGIRYSSHRPVVMGRRGMVCASHPLASQAGVRILQKGGNAVDASVAVAAALNVVEPLMSGIGGDGFIMVYTRADDTVKVVNATGPAPYAATRERYLPEGIPLKGILSMSVPGLLRGWTEAHERYGVLSLSEVLEPAVELAEEGFPVSHTVANAIAADELLCQFPTSAAIFTRDGRPLRAGEILYQKDLARTFQKIAQEGADVFYEGEIAQAVARFVEEQGGLLTMKDLADFRVRWQDSISTGYRGYSVHEAPPNSSGHVLLQELNLVERFDLKSMGCNTPESVHLMAEAKKLAFADREAYLADPEYVDVPIPGLLSKEYARHRAESIDLDRAALRSWGRRPVAIPESPESCASGRQSRGQADGRHHLLRDCRPLGERGVAASEPAERLWLQLSRCGHGHPSQQPDELLAPGGRPRGLPAARQAGAAHDESGDGVSPE